jgi:hypothetical protein
LGRWVSCDPIGVIGGFNIYAYTQGNPILLVDLNGKDPTVGPIQKEINQIKSPLGWFFAQTAYDFGNVLTLGTLKAVESQENLGTWDGLEESGIHAGMNIANTLTYGVLGNVMETVEQEGFSAKSVGKGFGKAVLDMTPIDEVKVLHDPRASGEEKAVAVAMGISKSAGLVILGAGLTSKNPVLTGKKAELGVGYTIKDGSHGHSALLAGPDEVFHRMGGKVSYEPTRPTSPGWRFSPLVEVPAASEAAAMRVAESAAHNFKRFSLNSNNCSQFTGKALRAAGIHVLTITPLLQYLNFKYAPFLLKSLAYSQLIFAGSRQAKTEPAPAPEPQSPLDIHREWRVR